MRSSLIYSNERKTMKAHIHLANQLRQSAWWHLPLLWMRNLPCPCRLCWMPRVRWTQVQLARPRPWQKEQAEGVSLPSFTERIWLLLGMHPLHQKRRQWNGNLVIFVIHSVEEPTSLHRCASLVFAWQVYLNHIPIGIEGLFAARDSEPAQKRRRLDVEERRNHSSLRLAETLGQRCIFILWGWSGIGDQNLSSLKSDQYLTDQSPVERRLLRSKHVRDSSGVFFQKLHAQALSLKAKLPSAQTLWLPGLPSVGDQRAMSTIATGIEQAWAKVELPNLGRELQWQEASMPSVIVIIPVALPGMGKSSLLEALFRRCQQGGVKCYRQGKLLNSSQSIDPKFNTLPIRPSSAAIVSSHFASDKGSQIQPYVSLCWEGHVWSSLNFFYTTSLAMAAEVMVSQERSWNWWGWQPLEVHRRTVAATSARIGRDGFVPFVVLAVLSIKWTSEGMTRNRRDDHGSWKKIGILLSQRAFWLTLTHNLIHAEGTAASSWATEVWSKMVQFYSLSPGVHAWWLRSSHCPLAGCRTLPKASSRQIPKGSGRFLEISSWKHREGAFALVGQEPPTIWTAERGGRAAVSVQEFGLWLDSKGLSYWLLGCWSHFWSGEWVAKGRGETFWSLGIPVESKCDGRMWCPFALKIISWHPGRWRNLAVCTSEFLALAQPFRIGRSQCWDSADQNPLPLHHWRVGIMVPKPVVRVRMVSLRSSSFAATNPESIAKTFREPAEIEAFVGILGASTSIQWLAGPWWDATAETHRELCRGDLDWDLQTSSKFTGTGPAVSRLTTSSRFCSLIFSSKLGLLRVLSHQGVKSGNFTHLISFGICSDLDCKHSLLFNVHSLDFRMIFSV